MGKWDKFPVSGAHASTPGGETAEQPLLLNPLIDDPGEHLGIDDTGVLGAHTERGQACIRILGLNLRESLIKDRADAIEETRNTLLSLAVACAQRNAEEQTKQLTRLNGVVSGAAPFAMARRYAVRLGRGDFGPLLSFLALA